MSNAYWDAVRDHIKPDDLYGGPCVDWTSWPPGGPVRPRRTDLVKRYAWTITDPDSVAFVVEHCGPRVLDPLAGTGWWALMLHRAGVDVIATDLCPPDGGDANPWHKGSEAWVPVLQADVAASVTTYGQDRTLLLSWPPYDDPPGAAAIRAYPGDRVVYIGELDGGCCGDDAMHDLLAAEWTQVAERRPVQWWGMHDWITVYDRKGGGSS